MKKQTRYPLSIVVLMSICIATITFISCEDEVTYNGEPITNDFRLLQIRYNDNVVSSPLSNFNPTGKMQLIFSHSLNKETFESGIIFSPTIDTNFSYDQTGSLVTIDFSKPLAYETEYTLSIPEGLYGKSGEISTEDYKVNFLTSAFKKPSISLSIDNSDLYEGDEVKIKASLNEAVLLDVSFDLLLAGTATNNSDYNIDKISFSIPAGEIFAEANISVISDNKTESAETLSLSLSQIVNGVSASDDPLVVNINDVPPAIEIKGVMELDNYINGSDGRVRAVHLNVLENISDMSVYGVEVASNGATPNPNDIDFVFPNVSANKGDQILVVRDADFENAKAFFETCFDSFSVFQTSKMTQNGDDAILLYKNEIAIESFGEPGTDGTGLFWEYTNSWAYKLDGNWLYAEPDGVEFQGSGTNNIVDAKYPFCIPLQLQGVTALRWTGDGTNSGKSIHVRANSDIEDLSIYGLGVANNGGGTDGVEYTFPSISVKEGDQILIAREPGAISTFYGNCSDNFDVILQADFVSQNGDDAIELFLNNTVVETYGDANLDGTGQTWEYTGSWAYKLASGWINGSLDCASTATTNSNSECPYPLCN